MPMAGSTVARSSCIFLMLAQPPIFFSYFSAPEEPPGLRDGEKKLDNSPKQMNASLPVKVYPNGAQIPLNGFQFVSTSVVLSTTTTSLATFLTMSSSSSSKHLSFHNHHQGQDPDPPFSPSHTFSCQYTGKMKLCFAHWCT